MNILKKMSIRSKFIILMLIVSISSIIAIGVIGNRSGERILKCSVSQKLDLLKDMKARQIKNYLNTIKSNLKMLSSDKMVADAMREFIVSYNLAKYNALSPKEEKELKEYYKKNVLPFVKKGSEAKVSLENILPKTVAANYLQYHYIVKNSFAKSKDKLIKADDNSSYSKIHAKFHASLKDICDHLGFKDLYFIEAESGEIVYSVKKEIDFASSLKVGDYRKSNFAALVKKLNRSVAKGSLFMSDFESYIPSCGKPAAFVGITVYDGDEFLGILAVRIGSGKIDEILSENGKYKAIGLGKSGEIYILGSDYKMRSQSRFMQENPKKFLKQLEKINIPAKEIEEIKRYHSTILHLKVTTKSAKKALEGKDGIAYAKNYLGQKVLSSYAPLHLDFLNWAIIVEQGAKEAGSEIVDFREKFAVSTIVIIFLVTLFAMLSARAFTKPVNALIKGVRGNKGKVCVDSSDEFGELADSYNSMMQKIKTQKEEIEQKDNEINHLLLDIMPETIVKRYLSKEEDIIEKHSNVTVLFTSLTGLSELYERYSHDVAFKRHNDLFESFDNAAIELGVEKIKTIGDDYMAASGLINPRFNHAQKAVDFAVKMLDIIEAFNRENGTEIGIRIGLDSGDVYAGLVGNIKIEYNVWGNTVDIASALRYYTCNNSIRITKIVYELLTNKEQFAKCKSVEIEEFGVVESYQYGGCKED